MPDPDRLLNILRRAFRFFHETPGRRGRLIGLEDAGAVLVAGDLHGNVENFRRLLTLADLKSHPRRQLVLQEVVHGPFRYPAGGDKSHQLLDLVSALKCQFPKQVHMLLGNHELAQWTGRKITKGDLDLNNLFRLGVETAYGARADEIWTAYFELFAVMPLALRTPNRIFLSHSLPSAKRLPQFELSLLEKETHEEKDWNAGGPLYSLVWGRDTALATVSDFLRKVDAHLLITGHIPCAQGFEVPNERQVILDSQGTPACYCLFPADRDITHQELVACVGVLC